MAGCWAARRAAAMLGHAHAGEGAAEDLRMRGDEPRPVVDVDPIFRFADLELASDQETGTE